MPDRRVLVTGPESTGKTALCEALATRFGGNWIPEYARSYVHRLGRAYQREDVLHIAGVQKDQYHGAPVDGTWIFFDTWLIITKVWLEVVNGSSPDWIDREIGASEFCRVLLCYPDLPWEPDDIRENGGAARFRLCERYEEILRHHRMPYCIIRGTGDRRLAQAIECLESIDR